MMERSSWLVRLTVALALTVVAVMGLSSVALAATPSQPLLADTWVSGVGKVSVRWYAATDADGHGVDYWLYRDIVPVTAARIASGESTLVASDINNTTWQTNATVSEIAQSYVWYYAVVAEDDLGNKSVPSLNMSPNLHGYRFDVNLIACTRCHSAHGVYKIPYTEKGSCYTCHGSTGFSAPLGAKSTYNTEASFYDTGTVSAGSKHRNQYMSDTKQECAACHSPHRSPYFYTAVGVYDAASSYRRMLRIEYATSTYAYYSRNSAPAQANEFCFSCHGNSAVTWDGKTINASTAIGVVGGPDAYANAGGDHNYAGYAASAHGTGVIYSNDYDASAATTDNPAVQCEACHHNHASATDKLIDYRSSDTTNAATWAQANLCYGCHSAASTETSVNTAVTTKPFAWNSRDVKAQFAKRSHHPTSPTSTGTYVATHYDTWLNTTAAEFGAYTASGTQATNVSGGEIILSEASNPPAEPWVYANRGGQTDFDGYDLNAATWNSGFDPAAHASFSPASGSSSYWVNDKTYTTAGDPGTNSAAQYVFDPTMNTWAAAQTLADTVGIGGDSTVNTSSADTVVYFTRGDRSAGLTWWDYTGTTTGAFTFYYSSAARTLGQGSALAYAPASDRLFVIRNDGTNGTTTNRGDGRLYYRADPARNTATTYAWTPDDPVVRPGTSAATYARMTRFVKNGVDYLMIIGTDAGGTTDTMIVSDLGGAITVRELGDGGPFGAGNALGDGCDLEWDGGSYLYASRGSTGEAWRRILIPNNPATDTWAAWSANLTAPQWSASTDWPAGSSFAIGTYDPPATYGTSGNAITGDILPYAQAHHWGRVTWSETEASSTDVSVTAQGWNGTWTTLASKTDTSPIDLSSYSTSTYSKLRLRVDLSTSNTSNTSTLYNWAVTSIFDQWAPDNGTLTCVNCHNVHSVTRGATVTSPWQMDRVSDPENTKNNYTGTPTQFCLECHDGATAESTITATSLVPYTAGFRVMSPYPFFTGWNKNAGGAAFSSSGHAATTIKQLDGQFGCETCHDPHASDNARLTALTASGGSTGSNHLSATRLNTTAYSEEDLCYACHDARRTNNCSAIGCHNTSMAFLDVKTSFSSTYSHPVGVDGRHSDTETASGLGSGNRHADCADCHDPHAAQYGTHTEPGVKTSEAADVLLGSIGVNPNYGSMSDANNWTAPAASGYTPTRADGETADYEAYMCFKCHSAYSGQPFSVTTTSGAYTSTDLAKEFNPSNFSEHNVLGQSIAMDTSFIVGGTTYSWAKPADSAFLKTGWTSNSAMTCTDCHTGSTTEAKGPHGSSIVWLLDEGYTNWTSTTTLSNSTVSGISSDTVICAKCHTGLHSVNWVHENHENWPDGGGNRCQMCHPRVPHGWKRPRLVGSNQTAGITALKAKTITDLSSSWSQSDCQAACDSRHSATPSPAYP